MQMFEKIQRSVQTFAQEYVWKNTSIQTFALPFLGNYIKNSTNNSCIGYTIIANCTILKDVYIWLHDLL